MKAIMFDMDGTLLDSIEGWINSYKKFLEEENLTENLELKQLLDKKRLLKKCQIIKEYFKLDMTQMDIYKRCLVYVKKDYDTKVKPKKDVIEALEYLKNKGYKISLNTATKMPLCQDCLKKWDMIKYFDYIQTCKECNFLKDDEKFYEIAIERHHEKPEDIIFFDDNFEPLETAKKLNIKTVLVYDKDTSAEEFENRNDFDFKVKNISIETLQKIGL